jgi:hypothetical protein
MPDVTASVAAPRVAAIEYPLGRSFGQPGDTAGQTAVLRATLKALSDIDEPGEVVHLPFSWPESPKEVHNHPHDPPPISKAIRRRPWLYRNLLAGDIPAEYRSGKDSP